MRFNIFTNHTKFIEAHDPVAEGHTVAINEMSDWTDEEFGIVSGRFNIRRKKAQMLGNKQKLKIESD